MKKTANKTKRQASNPIQESNVCLHQLVRGKGNPLFQFLSPNLYPGNEIPGNPELSLAHFRPSFLCCYI